MWKSTCQHCLSSSLRRHQSTHVTILHDRTNTRGKAQRIKRHIDGTQAQHSLHSCDCICRFSEPDSHTIATTNSKFSERVCEAVRQIIEFTISQTRIRTFHS